MPTRNRCKICNRLGGADGFCKTHRPIAATSKEAIEKEELKKYNCPICKDTGFNSSDGYCHACRLKRKFPLCPHCDNEGFGSADRMCSHCRPTLPGREDAQYLIRKNFDGDYGEGFKKQPFIEKEYGIIKEHYEIERGFDGN